jgi:hypothetical protein
VLNREHHFPESPRRFRLPCNSNSINQMPVEIHRYTISISFLNRSRKSSGVKFRRVCTAVGEADQLAIEPRLFVYRPMRQHSTTSSPRVNIFQKLRAGEKSLRVSSPFATARKMQTFTLPDSHPECLVSLPKDLTKDQLLDFRPFDSWVSTLKESITSQSDPKHPFHTSPYKLRSIHVQSVDWFGSRIGFLKLKAEITNDNGGWLPGAVFMRGVSVAILVIFYFLRSDL